MSLPCLASARWTSLFHFFCPDIQYSANMFCPVGSMAVVSLPKTGGRRMGVFPPSGAKREFRGKEMELAVGNPNVVSRCFKRWVGLFVTGTWACHDWVTSA